MTKLLIIDDHESLRDSFRSCFEATGEYTIVAESSDARFALMLCEKHRPDLVLLDVCTDGGSSGLVAAREIKAAYPKIKLIVMSGFDEISYAPRAKEAGADAFVYKSKNMAFFLSVAKEVLQGKTYFPEPKTIPTASGDSPLTDRELEILRLVCQYKSRREIADELFISENTVKFHIGNMLQKTGCRSVAELAINMISNGYINPRY